MIQAVTRLPSLRSDNKTWCKICGISEAQHVRLCAQLGVDAIGLVFVPESPRALSLAQAQVLAAAASIARVGLFVNSDAGFVTEAIAAGQLTLLQFQGDESPEYCRQFGLPYIRALQVTQDTDIGAFCKLHREASAILLDAYVPGQRGGTGQVFDWALWPDESNTAFILAGGLTPTNVGEAIERLRPAGVDVSGGVEGPVKGKKDENLMRKFVREVQDVG